MIELPQELAVNDTDSISAEADKVYEDTFNQLSELQKDKFSATKCIEIMATHKTKQLISLIGQNVPESDKEKIFAIVHRHIVGKVFKG